MKHTSHIPEPAARTPGARIGLTIAAVVIACSLAGCGKGKTPKSTEKPVKTGTKQEARQPDDSLKASFKKAEMTWEDSKGRRVWEARFKEAVLAKDQSDSTVELIGVEAKLYQEGKFVSSLAAPRVVADGRAREIRAAGGVKLLSRADNSLLHAERLVWKARENKVSGAGNVRMKRNNLSVTATAFEADTALKKARFRNGRLQVN